MGRYILCGSCLLRGVQKLLPKDVGMALEDEGPVLGYMSVRINSIAAEHVKMTVLPTNVRLRDGLST